VLKYNEYKKQSYLFVSCLW